MCYAIDGRQWTRERGIVATIAKFGECNLRHVNVGGLAFASSKFLLLLLILLFFITFAFLPTVSFTLLHSFD